MLSLKTLNAGQAPAPPVAFTGSEFLTLGVEVEVQLLDQRTLDLVPAAPRLLEELGDDLAFKPEFYQTMLEMCTGISHNLADVEADLADAQARLLEVADRNGLAVIGIGTHPFSGLGSERDVSPGTRYHRLMRQNQWIARNKNIFGLHVHVGVRDGDHAIQMVNAATPYLSLLLALSASSPFWHGQDTGLASARATSFESQPTSGPAPQVEDWNEFEMLIAGLRRSQAIESLKDLHWDIRPSPTFGTVEVRICDGQPCLADTLALVGVTQCLFAWLDERLRSGLPLQPTPAWRLRENKWRVIRYGMDARVIIDDQGTVRPIRDEWLELLDTWRPLARRLGCSRALRRAERMVLTGPSYVRQRALLRRDGDLRSVVRALAEEFRA